MWSPTLPSRPGVPRPSVKSVLLSPLRPRTYGNLAYLLLAFPLGIAYLVFLTVGFSVGGALVVVAVGVPILLFVLACCHLGAWFERLTARYLLGLDIRSPGYPFLEADGFLARLRALVLGRETWAAAGYLASKFAIGVAAFVLVTTLLSTSLALLSTPLYYDDPNASVGVHLSDPITLTPSLRIPWGELLIGAEFAVTVTGWTVTTLPAALAVSAVGLASLAVSLAALNGIAWLVGRFTRFLLGAADRSPDAAPRADPNGG